MQMGTFFVIAGQTHGFVQRGDGNWLDGLAEGPCFAIHGVGGPEKDVQVAVARGRQVWRVRPPVERRCIVWPRLIPVLAGGTCPPEVTKGNLRFGPHPIALRGPRCGFDNGFQSCSRGLEGLGICLAGGGAGAPVGIGQAEAYPPGVVRGEPGQIELGVTLMRQCIGAFSVEAFGFGFDGLEIRGLGVG